MVTLVAPDSPAQRAGVRVGDSVRSLNGVVPRDVIEWRLLADEPEVDLLVERQGLEVEIAVTKAAGQPLGAEVSSAVFDRVRTCDNHCAFCFIHQLPPGMRRSLYLKDDDYRLSFLYGNFTTLTRFTEADLERVIDEGLSPLNVSIHATDPEVRREMLRNRRGGMSLRWLRELLDAGVAVNGQIVVCPGVNDGAVLDDTLLGILDGFPELRHVAVVPLGTSRYNTEPLMRPHTADEAAAVLAVVREWQEIFLAVLGRRMVFAADEYHLVAGEPFPPSEHYEGFEMHEDGIGMVRTFEDEFHGRVGTVTSPRSGFFQWVDGAPAEGYRAPRNPAADTGLRGCSSGSTVTLRARRDAPVALLTGAYGERVLAPLVADRDGVRIVVVDNQFFGGNTAVAGLLTGADVSRVLSDQPRGHRYLLPDVCLSEGRFLDGLTVDDLPRTVEVVPTDGRSLRSILDGAS